jgi:hypothetical protein
MRIYSANSIHEEIKLHRRDLEDKCTSSERFDGQARWPSRSAKIKLALRTMTRVVLLVCAAALLPCLASAKRAAPAKVEPVIYQGVRYVAPNDDGRRAYIAAWDIQTNKKLWELTIFANRIDPKLEEDVQWVFINKLSIRGDVLIVTSERGATYQIDLKTKAITESDPAQSQAPGETAQLHDIPEPIQRAITNGSLAKNYDLSFRMNPFYLRGDFNGDGKIDVAVLVKQRSTGKLGIAIVHGTTDKVTILGAGVGIGNGGDNFEWMDSWQVYSKGHAAREAGETNVPHLRGDALLVGKSEAASALIYWNGKRYVWLQQGD